MRGHAQSPPKLIEDPEVAAARDHAALAGALDPIITIDALGTIQSASDSVQRLFGWTPAELEGRNIRVLMPEPHHSAHDGYLLRYRQTGKTNIMNRTRRFEAVRKDGTIFPIELSVSRANNPGQALFVGIIRDASAQVAAELSSDESQLRLQQQVTQQTEALESAHLRLRMADRLASLGTLAAGLGHDMNNVLLPVRARLNALRAEAQEGKLSAPARKHVEEVRKSVAYLQQLADGLHFLAADPEKTSDAPTSLDLASWWPQSGPLISKAVPRHVKVTASFPPGLPKVSVAPHGLTQAILNLVVNAGEAIPPPEERKRRQGRVRVFAQAVVDAAGRARVRLSVSDNGRGMSDEVKRRAFEMFFTTKPRGLGTGLGLALVRKVADRAGGSVEIQSEVGVGSTVTIIFSVSENDPAGARLQSTAAVISMSDGRASSLMHHLLESAGATVQDADTPAQADIWVTQPEPARLEAARAWRTGRPDGRLVLFGRPSSIDAAGWRALAPIQIEDTTDFEALRTAISRAVTTVAAPGASANV